MTRQLKHSEYGHEYKKHNINLVLDNLDHLENIGSVFRLSDAFCVKKIFILDDKNLFLPENAKENYKKIDKTARNCMNYVEYVILPTDTFLNAFDKKHKLMALEITNNSKPLNEVTFNKAEEIYLIIGNEKNGVSEALLKNVNSSVHIPMYGVNSSLNVATAVSIALYEITNQINK